jgi:hypothetical protein
MSRFWDVGFSPSTNVKIDQHILPFNPHRKQAPVFKLNVHECHGQTTASPSNQPCPSGPCRWGQTLSTADNSPFTFARQIPTPSASASITFPAAGASPNPHNLTHCATLKPSNLHPRAFLISQ